MQCKNMLKPSNLGKITQESLYYNPHVILFKLHSHKIFYNASTSENLNILYSFNSIPMNSSPLTLCAY